MFQRGARWGVRKKGVSVHMQDLTTKLLTGYLLCIHLPYMLRTCFVHASYIHTYIHIHTHKPLHVPILSVIDPIQGPPKHPHSLFLPFPLIQIFIKFPSCGKSFFFFLVCQGSRDKIFKPCFNWPGCSPSSQLG